jgi:hypothetical protein
MTSFPTLPTGPLEHVAMDYARLREEGVRLLGRLTGAQWTDYNAHDPGITILEQLCYAITDLGYRTAHPMPDLLAGAGADAALPGAETILGGDPVTQDDLRKLVLDVEGIANAWALPVEPELPFYYHQGSGELRLEADFSELDARPVRLKGLQQLALRASDRLPGDQAIAQVAGRVHARRGLGEDVTFSLLATHEVWIQAKIEVGPMEDPASVHADIVEQIEAYLAPPVHFTTLSDARARGHRVDELFEGPTLAHGFLLGELPTLRRSVRASDLIHAIMDVPAVRTVRSLALATSATAPRERWALEIPAGHVATLATGSEITLLRAGLPVRVELADVQARLEERRAVARTTGTIHDARNLRPPAGRDRGLARYRSLQYQLPAGYGVGALGLPASASATRQAQARQLAAYLQIFDQLLANAFAQLAHAHELLSPGNQGARSYFVGELADPRLHHDELIRTDMDLHRAWLATAVESVHAGADPLERRKRFLAHLLARFGEQLGDHAQIGDTARRADDDTLIADRQAFLREYPRLSGARGSGPDLFGEPDALSGLEQRLRLKLGLRDGHPFHLVEHVLLRPIPEDSHQHGDEADPQVPLYAGVLEHDPWSLQISYVFAAGPDDAIDVAFEQMVAQTILAETPAHLRPQLHWFGADADEAGEDHWSAFTAAWLEFRAAYRAYRAAKLRATLVPDEIHLRARDTRDRVIDLLGFARSYPLRDLPTPSHLIVAPGARATIRVEFSQKDVVYGLRDRRTGAPIVDDGAPIEALGTGATVELTTPPIDEDVDFRILAVKVAGKDSPGLRREAWLHRTVRVEEGVDPTLVAQIEQPLLDFRIDAPQPADARITDFGAVVEVHVFASQEGVAYTLRDDADHTRVLSEATVIGTSGTIVLRTVPVSEDVDLRVHGSKAAGDPQNPELRTALLDLVLPLRVRANPALTVKFMQPAVVAYAGELTVRVSKSQKSAQYQLWRRRVRDHEFVFFDPQGAETLDVKLADGRTIRVLRPSRPAVWQDLGFAPVGEPRGGNGSALDLTLAGLTDDTLVLVQASKRHRKIPLAGDDAGETITSAVQMAQGLVALTLPDPGRALRIEANIAGDATVGPLLLRDGQPGVFYTLRRIGVDAPIGEPAYFHKRDEPDVGRNKGIDGLRIEVDLVIARAGAEADPATLSPPPPLIEITALELPASLTAQARKAMTGLEAPLTATAELPVVPAITAEPASVIAGAAARIVVAASVADERYLLLRDGEVVQEAAGTGAALELDTGPLAATTTFTVAIVRDQAIVVERRVRVAVDVQPGG